MGGKKTMEDSRRFEKVRRDKLNVAFTKLGELLPEHDPSVTLSKIDILRKATMYIKDLQKQNEEIIKLGSDSVLKNEADKLKKRVAHVVLKTKELMNVLQKAGIAFPLKDPISKKKKTSGSNQHESSSEELDVGAVWICSCFRNGGDKQPLKEVNTGNRPGLEKPTPALVALTPISSSTTLVTFTSPPVNSSSQPIPPSHDTSNPTNLPVISQSGNSNRQKEHLKVPLTSFSSTSTTTSIINDTSSSPPEAATNSQTPVIRVTNSNTLSTRTIVVSSPQNYTSIQTNNTNVQSIPINLGSSTVLLADGRFVNVPQIIPPVIVKPPQTVLLLPAAKRKDKFIMPKKRDVTKTTFANKAPIPAIPPFRLQSCPKILPKKVVKSANKIPVDVGQMRKIKKQKIEHKKINSSPEKVNQSTISKPTNNNVKLVNNSSISVEQLPYCKNSDTTLNREGKSCNNLQSDETPSPVPGKSILEISTNDSGKSNSLGEAAATDTVLDSVQEKGPEMSVSPSENLNPASSLANEAHIITDEGHIITDEAHIITDKAHIITDEAHFITDEVSSGNNFPISVSTSHEDPISSSDVSCTPNISIAEPPQENVIGNPVTPLDRGITQEVIGNIPTCIISSAIQKSMFPLESDCFPANSPNKILETDRTPPSLKSDQSCITSEDKGSGTLPISSPGISSHPKISDVSYNLNEVSEVNPSLTSLSSGTFKAFLEEAPTPGHAISHHPPGDDSNISTPTFTSPPVNSSSQPIPPSHDTSNPTNLPVISQSGNSNRQKEHLIVPLASVSSTSNLKSITTSIINDTSSSPPEAATNSQTPVITITSSNTLSTRTIVVSSPQNYTSIQTNNTNVQSIPINLGSSTVILADGRFRNVPQIIPPVTVKPPQTVVLLPAAKRKKDKFIMLKKRDVTKTTFANKAPIPAIPPFRLESCPKILPKKVVKAANKIHVGQMRKSKKQKIEHKKINSSPGKVNQSTISKPTNNNVELVNNLSISVEQQSNNCKNSDTTLNKEGKSCNNLQSDETPSPVRGKSLLETSTNDSGKSNSLGEAAATDTVVDSVQEKGPEMGVSPSENLNPASSQTTEANIIADEVSSGDIFPISVSTSLISCTPNISITEPPQENVIGNPVTPLDRGITREVISNIPICIISSAIQKSMFPLESDCFPANSPNKILETDRTPPSLKSDQSCITSEDKDSGTLPISSPGTISHPKTSDVSCNLNEVSEVNPSLTSLSSGTFKAFLEEAPTPGHAISHHPPGGDSNVLSISKDTLTSHELSTQPTTPNHNVSVDDKNKNRFTKLSENQPLLTSEQLSSNSHCHPGDKISPPGNLNSSSNGPMNVKDRNLIAVPKNHSLTNNLVSISSSESLVDPNGSFTANVPSLEENEENNQESIQSTSFCQSFNDNLSDKTLMSENVKNVSKKSESSSKSIPTTSCFSSSTMSSGVSWNKNHNSTTIVSSGINYSQEPPHALENRYPDKQPKEAYKSNEKRNEISEKTIFHHQQSSKTDQNHLFSDLRTFVGQDSASTNSYHEMNISTTCVTSNAPVNPTSYPKSTSKTLSVNFFSNASQSSTINTSVQAGIPKYPNFPGKNIFNSVSEIQPRNSSNNDIGASLRFTQASTMFDYQMPLSNPSLFSKKPQSESEATNLQSPSKINGSTAPNSAPVSFSNGSNTLSGNPNFSEPHDHSVLGSLAQTSNRENSDGMNSSYRLFPTGSYSETTKFFPNYSLNPSKTSLPETYHGHVSNYNPPQTTVPGIYSTSYLTSSTNLPNNKIPNDKNNLSFPLFCSSSTVSSPIFTQSETSVNSSLRSKDGYYDPRVGSDKFVSYSQLPNSMTSSYQIPPISSSTDAPHISKSSSLSQTNLNNIPKSLPNSHPAFRASESQHTPNYVEKSGFENSASKNSAATTSTDVFRVPLPPRSPKASEVSGKLPTAVNNFHYNSRSIPSANYSESNTAITPSQYSSSTSFTHAGQFQTTETTNVFHNKEVTRTSDKNKCFSSSAAQHKSKNNEVYNITNYSNSNKDTSHETSGNALKNNNNNAVLNSQMSSRESNANNLNDKRHNYSLNAPTNTTSKANSTELSSIVSYPNQISVASNTQMLSKGVSASASSVGIPNRLEQPAQTHSLNKNDKDIRSETSVSNSSKTSNEQFCHPKTSTLDVNFSCDMDGSRNLSQSYLSQDFGNFKLPDPPLVGPCYSNFPASRIVASSNHYSDMTSTVNNISKPGTDPNNSSSSNPRGYKSINKFPSPNITDSNNYREKQKNNEPKHQNSIPQSKLDMNIDSLKSKDTERNQNTFLPIGYDDLRFPPDFSSDLFNSLQVPGVGQQSESISPTAAFLLAFPLVSTSRNPENPNEAENHENQTSTPTTILQIGNIDTPNTELFQSMEFQKNNSRPSDNKNYFDINSDYLQLSSTYDKTSSTYKRCEKRKENEANSSKQTPDSQTLHSSYSLYSNSLQSCNTYHYNEKNTGTWQQDMPHSTAVSKDLKKPFDRKKEKETHKAYYNQNYQDCGNYKERKRKQQTRISVNWMSTPENRDNEDFLSKEHEGYGTVPVDFPTESFSDLATPRKTGSSSWSPSKSLLPSLDSHLLIPSTLPTLVGDLALGTSTPSDSCKTLEPTKSHSQTSSTKKTSDKLDEINKHNNLSKSPSNFFSVSQLVDPKTKKPKSIDKNNYRRNEKNPKPRFNCNKRKDDPCMFYGDTTVPEKRPCYKGGSYSAESLIGAQGQEMEYTSSYNYPQNANYLQNDYPSGVEPSTHQYGYPQGSQGTNFAQEECQEFGYGATDSNKTPRKENYARPPYQTYPKTVPPTSQPPVLSSYATTSLTNFNLSTIFPEMNDQERASTSGQQLSNPYPNSHNFSTHISH